MLRASRLRINYFYQFDRLVKIDYPDMPNVVLQYGAAGAPYNAAGRITHVTDQSGITDYQYGKLGETVAEKRQLQSLTGDSRLVSFENDFRYDYLGRMEWMRYPDGEELTYTYDRGGEVKAVTGVKHSHSRTYVQQISYDEFGQRVYLKYGNGVTTNYSYDPNRRWLKEIDTTEKGGKALQRSAYLFDLVGNVSSVTNTAYKTVSQTYSYDDLYQLVGAKGTYTPHEKRRSDIYQQAFAYDDIGNMVEKTSTHQWTSASDDPDGLQYARAYKYDTDRPHTAVRVGGWTYQYDLNGNLLWRGLDDRSREVYDGPGEGHQGGDWLKHDTAGGSSSSSDERSLVATQHADEGRDNDHDRGWGEAYKWGFKHWRDPPVGEKVQQYSWDSENRLKLAQQDGQSVKFLYDREGNRTVKKGARGETLYVDRYYQVQNRDEAAKHIFVGDTRIATRLSDYDHDDWSYEEASLYYYHPDHLGSTTFVTDRDGDEYQHLEYTPYGESWIDEGSNKHLVGYRFTGKELDEETGLYYFGARYLDPQVSIWLNADPAMGKYLPETPVNEEAKKRNGKLPGEGGVFNPFNLAVYHYSSNNPLKYKDPNGMAGQAEEGVNFPILRYIGLFKSTSFADDPRSVPILTQTYTDRGEQTQFRATVPVKGAALVALLLPSRESTTEADTPSKRGTMPIHETKGEMYAEALQSVLSHLSNKATYVSAVAWIVTDTKKENILAWGQQVSTSDRSGTPGFTTFDSADGAKKIMLANPKLVYNLLKQTAILRETGPVYNFDK